MLYVNNFYVGILYSMLGGNGIMHPTVRVAIGPPSDKDCMKVMCKENIYITFILNSYALVLRQYTRSKD